MPAYYRSVVSEFVRKSPSEVVGLLALANSQNERFKLSAQTIDAWQDQLGPLINGFVELVNEYPCASNWTVLLEYPIPRIGKRIDAILIAHDVIVVIETKTGLSPTTAERQADDYSISLACFHEPSAGRIIAPLVISDSPTSKSGTRPYEDDRIRQCRIATTRTVGQELAAIVASECDISREHLSPDEFDQGRFRPIPPIIDAAVALYSEMNVFEIGHACSGKEDLQNSTDALVQIVERAKANNDKAVCFVTGVPGAGKTLVGLNAVHRPEIREVGSFLSGNGPLVKIIREALIRDVVSRRSSTGARITRRAAELAVQTFIQSVHGFAEDHYQSVAREPFQRVLIFDEAQRAWDAEENERHDRPNVAEAHMIFDIMSRKDGWCVVIALIGGGQEINRGEAGLAEWGRSLAAFPEWKVFVSPEMLKDDAPKQFQLFKSPDQFPSRLCEEERLHLKVSTRSIRAQNMSDWVENFLTGNAILAKEIANEMTEPPLMTRSLEILRRWLDAKRRGFTRSGLVCSATAARMRADGIEPSYDFHRRFEWEKWFLDKSECDDNGCSHRYCNDVRSSSKLEVAATQFEVQGLELDWVGLCWGEDLIWSTKGWKANRFNNKRWRSIEPTSREFDYQINGYRVLLTRARQGLVIYVPNPRTEEFSRLADGLNSTSEFLQQCGVRMLPR